MFFSVRYQNDNFFHTYAYAIRDQNWHHFLRRSTVGLLFIKRTVFKAREVVKDRVTSDDKDKANKETFSNSIFAADLVWLDTRTLYEAKS